MLDLCEFFQRFPQEIITKETNLLLVSKLFSIKPFASKQLVTLLEHSFRLSKLVGDENRGVIYENVLKIFMELDYFHKDYL